MVRAFLFDVDGTLVDSVDYHALAWQETFRRFGREIAFEEIRAQIGKGGDQLMPVFFAPEELERIGKEMEQFRKDLYRGEYLPRVLPFPGVPDLFRRIRGDGDKIVLVTSATREEVERLTDVLQVRQLIDGATSADDVEVSKPHPDIMVAGRRLLQDTQVHQYIVVGDSPYDAQAAGRADMPAIGVLAGGFPEADLRAAGCMAIFHNPADMLARYDELPRMPAAA